MEMQFTKYRATAPPDSRGPVHIESVPWQGRSSNAISDHKGGNCCLKFILKSMTFNIKQRTWANSLCLQPIMPMVLETLAADYFPISVSVQGQG